MKNTLQSSAFILLASLIIFCAFYFFAGVTPSAHATASELPAAVATTSVFAVSATPSLVFATSTCGARVISTTASPIMIGFSDNQGFVPSAITGMLQAASTTVTYSNGSFGCGAVRVYSFVTGSITVMESR